MRDTEDTPPADGFDPAAEVTTAGPTPDPAQDLADDEHPGAGDLIDPDLTLAELEEATLSEEAQD